MRWPVFLIVSLLALVLERGLRPLLSLQIGPYEDVAPSFLLVVAVFVALGAPRATVYWALMLIGVLVDVKSVLGSTATSDVVIVGPHAIGFLLGAWVAIHLRNIMFREALTTMVVMTLVVGLFVALVVVALLTLRGLPLLPTEPIPNWEAIPELLSRLLGVAYSGVLALPLGWLLGKTRPIWAFAQIRGGSK